MTSSTSAFLRILVPSWRFFDRVGFIAKLYARDPSGASGWQPLLVAPRLKWYSLFFNPEGNLYHAFCNAVERLVEDPHDPSNCQVVEDIVRHLLRSADWGEGSCFQFKVAARELHEGRWSEQDVLISNEFVL